MARFHRFRRYNRSDNLDNKVGNNKDSIRHPSNLGSGKLGKWDRLDNLDSKVVGNAAVVDNEVEEDGLHDQHNY